MRTDGSWKIIAFDNQENAYRIRVVSNLPRVSIMMPYDSGFGTLGLDLTQASTLCSRHETIFDEKISIERTYLIFDYY